MFRGKKKKCESLNSFSSTHARNYQPKNLYADNKAF